MKLDPVFEVASAVVDDVAQVVTHVRNLRLLGKMREALEVLNVESRGIPAHPELTTEALLCAFGVGDWAKAERLATALRAISPKQAEGYQLGSGAARLQDRHAHAEQILRDAGGQFDGSMWFEVERATVAIRLRAFGEALEYSERVRRLFPANPHGHLIGSAALRELGRHQEAAVLLGAAHEVLPDDRHIVTGLAQVLQAAGDAVRAVVVAARVRERYPEEQGGYTVGIWASNMLGDVKDSVELAEQAVAAFPAESWPYANAAGLSLTLGRYVDAERSASHMRTAFPDLPAGYLLGGQACLSMLEYSAAQSIFQQLVLRRPEIAEGHIGLYDAARVVGNWKAAETALQDAAKKFPERPDIATSLALVPADSAHERLRNWRETWRRFRDVERRFPTYADGHVRICARLRMCVRLEEAEQHIEEALTRFPSNEKIALEHAQVALDANRGSLSIDRFKAVMAEHPHSLLAACGLALALSRNNHAEEAMQAARELIDKYPHHMQPLNVAAEIATRHGEHELAKEYMEILGAKYPASHVYLHWAFLRGKSTDTVDSGGMDLTETFARFESLGGSGAGCEFGMVQRANKVENVGLLRFAAVQPINLLDAILHEFEGVGETRQTSVTTKWASDNSFREWIVEDMRFGVVAHTFQYEHQISRETVTEQALKRFGFLRRKLLQDIKAGKKIFVVGYAVPHISDSALLRLRDALSRDRPNWLLHVKLGDEAHPPGSVRVVGDRVVMGYLGYPARVAENEQMTPDVASWRRICAETLRMKLQSE